MPIFLERFLLYLCAGAFLGFVVNNGMGLDVHQRIGLGIALVGIAYFLGHTAYKSKPISPVQIQSAPTMPAPTIEQKCAENGPCSNVVAGRDATIDCSQPEGGNGKKDALEKH